MAETEFERDLAAMFDAAPSTADAAVFAEGVERRIARGKWLRLMVLAGFGVVGLAVSLVSFGLSAGDFAPLLANIAKVASGSPGALSDTGVWATGLLVLILGVIVARPALLEA